MTIRGLKKAILEVAALDVLEAKQAHPSMDSKTLNQIRAGNAQLGNRMKNRLGKQWRYAHGVVFVAGTFP